MDPQQQARQAVLDALLGRQPLPGGVRPLLFPDLPDLDTAPTVLLVADEDDPGLALPTHVRTVASSEMGRLSGEAPQTPVLTFLTPEAFADRVGVRLRVSMSDERGRLVPLGEVVATFTATADGALMISEPTHVLAY